MQEVVSQNPHLQPGLVGLKPLATGLVPAQSVFAFLDPIFHIPPAVIDLDHFTGRQSGVGDYKPDPGEKLAPVPLDLRHHPARPAPILGLVVEVNNLDLDTTLGWSAYWAVQVRFQEAHQVGIAWQPDEISDPPFLAIFVGFRVGKGSVSTQPEKFEPGTITLHQRLNKFERRRRNGRFPVSAWPPDSRHHR